MVRSQQCDRRIADSEFAVGLSDAAAARVLRSLSRAFAALLLARRLLNDQGAAPSDTLVDDLDLTLALDLGESTASESASEPPPLHWRDFLATRAVEDGTYLTSILREAVGDARRAGTAVLEDDDVETIRLHLVGAVASLSDARRYADST